jgi:hypothetical protein
MKQTKKMKTVKNVKLLFVLFIGIVLSTAYSCSKDDDNKDDDGGGSASPKTCYIKQETEKDGTYYKYEYNSHHKVIKDVEYNKSGTVISHTDYTYNNDGKISKEEDYDGSTLNMKYEYLYNAQGKISKVDYYEEQGGTLQKIWYYEYTFTGDDLTKVVKKVEYSGQTIEAEKYEFTYSGGNIVSEKDYEFDLSSLSLELTYSTEYEYDNKINPYKGIGLDYIVAYPMFLFISKANFTKLTMKDDQGVVVKDFSSNVTYEYNDNNYPTKATDVSFDNSETYITTFDYDCI